MKSGRGFIVRKPFRHIVLRVDLADVMSPEEAALPEVEFTISRALTLDDWSRHQRMVFLEQVGKPGDGLSTHTLKDLHGATIRFRTREEGGFATSQEKPRELDKLTADDRMFLRKLFMRVLSDIGGTRMQVLKPKSKCQSQPAAEPILPGSARSPVRPVIANHMAVS